MFTMEFDCKLAHQQEIKRISNFGSVKQLYEKISQSFAVPIDEILFCTLNTHNNRDMDALLGNYLSIGDLIIAHMCGQNKDINLKKKHEFLGLTITDNGLGRAFIKRVSSQDGSIEEFVKVGQHIVAINSESTVGLRHFEVAKALREIPIDSDFTMSLIEPLYSKSSESDRFHMVKRKDGIEIDLMMLKLDDSNNDLDERSIDKFSVRNLPNDSLTDDLVNSSLPIDKLLTRTGEITNQLGAYKQIIERINSTLESFLGIDDSTLAIQIYRLARENRDSLDDFINALRSSELSIFKFSPDMEKNLWELSSNL